MTLAHKRIGLYHICALPTTCFILFFLFCAFSSQVKANSFNLAFLSDLHVKPTSSIWDNIPDYFFGKDLTQLQFDENLAKLQATFHDEPLPEGWVVLGDMQAHRLKSSVKPDNLLTMVNSLASLNAPFVMVHGNNDAYDGNYQAFWSPIWGSPAFTLGAAFPGSQSGFMIDPLERGSWELNASNAYVGYFELKLADALTLVGLNSVPYNSEVSHVARAGGEQQAKWLKTTLQHLTHEGHSVLLAMHIPPGVSAYSNTPLWSDNRVLEILDEAVSQGLKLVGIFSGHSHMDEYRVFQHTNGRVTPLFVIPGFSTAHGNQSAFKQFKLVKVSNEWAIEDFSGYALASDSQERYAKYAGGDKMSLCGHLPVTACFQVFSYKPEQLFDKIKLSYGAGTSVFFPLKSPKNLIITKAG